VTTKLTAKGVNCQKKTAKGVKIWTRRIGIINRFNSRNTNHIKSFSSMGQNNQIQNKSCAEMKRVSRLIKTINSIKL
jgi:hypothetical protein